MSITKERITIGKIPAIIWRKPSEKAYIYVHGKLSRKEDAERFAELAEEKGFQTISFDLPKHGERINKDYNCNIWNGIADLKEVAEFVFPCRKEVCLFGCGIGPFFSLNAYQGLPFKKVLFLSPIADMELLINRMFKWFNVSEAELKEKGEIPTPIETLSWKYYTYIKNNHYDWNIPTAILYGELDNLQPIEAMEEFCKKFGAKLTVSEKSEHPFMRRRISQF